MDPKLNSSLQKILNLKEKGNFAKALSRLDGLISKNHNEAQLLFEALDISLEACESRKSCLYFKKAYTSFPEQRNRLWAFAKDRLKANNDQIFARYLIEQAVKSRDLFSSVEIIKSLGKDLIEEFLKRSRVKKKSIIAASHGKPELAGEILINIYSEALLFLGLGKRKESALGFMQIIEQRPGEIDCIEPFLKRLEEMSSGNSALSYALGCCYLARQKYDKALDLILLGVKKEKSFLDDFVERLSKIKVELETPPEDLDLVLAEALLMQRAIPQAAEVVQEILESRPAQAPAVLDLLAGYDEEEDEELLLRYLLIEAAIIAKHNSKATEKIRILYEEPKTRKSIMEWLDKKYNECALPQQALMCYGEMVLGENLIDKGIDILKSILSLSPSEERAIAGILKKYKDKDNKVLEFYEQIAPKEEPRYPSKDIELEVFEKSGFKFSSADDSPSPKENIERANETSPPSFSKNYDVNEQSHIPDETLFEKTPDKLFSGNVENKEKELQDTDEKTGSPDELCDKPTQITKEEPLGTGSSREKPALDSPRNSLEESEGRGDLKTRLKHFVEGKLDEDAELMLNEFSYLDEKEKLSAILSVKAKDRAAEVRRKFFLARYYLTKDAPMEALAILKSLSKSDIPKDLKRAFVMQMANCYRKLHMFDAAQGTLLYASDHFIEDSELERFSKLNYSDYLNQICRGAMILEKAGSLE